MAVGDKLSQLRMVHERDSGARVSNSEQSSRHRESLLRRCALDHSRAAAIQLYHTARCNHGPRNQISLEAILLLLLVHLGKLVLYELGQLFLGRSTDRRLECHLQLRSLAPSSSQISVSFLPPALGIDHPRPSVDVPRRSWLLHADDTRTQHPS